MPGLGMLALVAAGGAIGSVARFALSLLVQRAFSGTFLGTFPLGTFLVNVLGCFIFGLIVALVDGRPTPTARAFLLIGVLGGFTTFSSFGFETFQLLRDGALGQAIVNVGGQFVIGLAALWLGFSLPRLFQG